MDAFSAAAAKILLAFILGAVIGLERDTSHGDESTRQKLQPHSVAGLRTFSLISVLGCLAGFLSGGYPLMALALGCAMFGLIVVFYILQSGTSHDLGMTTEVVMIYCFILGFLISVEILPMQLLIALSIVLILILSRKEEIRKLTFGLHREERNAFISYALISAVILPFLPNRGFALQDIRGLDTFLQNYGVHLGNFLTTELVNPFKLWLIVALITGIDIAGYVLTRAIGTTKGRLVSSCVGGAVSSTATTQSIAQQSQKDKSTDFLVASAVLANMCSFFPIFVLVATVNGALLVRLTPVLICIVASALAVGLLFLSKAKKSAKPKDRQAEEGWEAKKNIISLKPALSFAVLFLAVRIITAAALVLIGQSGFLLASSLAAFTGIDAPTINVSELAGQSISFPTAVFAFVLINAVNMTAKSVYSYLQGSREFAVKFALSMLVIITASGFGLFFV